MKNIEKYTNTKDALEAFREWYKDHKHSVLTMSGWLEKEYEAPRVPTLLEAAEAVKNEWYTTFPNVMPDTLCETIVDLASAIAREKSKPVRNCDRFATAEEAAEAFVGFTRKNKEIADKISLMDWLYADVKKHLENGDQK